MNRVPIAMIIAMSRVLCGTAGGDKFALWTSGRPAQYIFFGRLKSRGNMLQTIGDKVQPEYLGGQVGIGMPRSRVAVIATSSETA